MGNQSHIESIVRGLALRAGHVLLCRDRAGGYCYLPGGHIEPGESAADALRRELLEETATPVRVGGLLLLQEHAFRAKREHHELNLILAMHIPARAAVQSAEDHLEMVWLDAAGIRRGDIRPACLKPWLIKIAKANRLPKPVAAGAWRSDMTL
jgi:8-oxo-dGTP diphosphatase